MAKTAKVKVFAASIEKSLGALAKDPIVACVLDELSRLEKMRNEIYSRYLDGDMVAAEQYKKYNQRFTDTYSKLLMTLKEKGQADSKRHGELSSRQKFLVGLADEKED